MQLSFPDHEMLGKHANAWRHTCSGQSLVLNLLLSLAAAQQHRHGPNSLEQGFGSLLIPCLGVRSASSPRLCCLQMEHKALQAKPSRFAQHLGAEKGLREHKELLEATHVDMLGVGSAISDITLPDSGFAACR